MRSYQVTHREGENMGPIDWNYDFWSHFGCMCSSDDRKREVMEQEIRNLFIVERLFRKGKLLQVRRGDYWHVLLDVGMYDGWPYWKPVPAICTDTPIGGCEWHQFPCVDEWKEK